MREKLIKLLYQAPCESEFEGEPGACPYRKYGQCGEIDRLDYCAVTHLADSLIANGVTVQEWIPVTERLPRKFLHVLAYTPGALEFKAKAVGEAWIGTDGCWHSPVLLVDNDKVTHWMPLPEPPKGE